MAGDSIIAIQDMGAAGLTSSSIEMASKGKLGIEINLNKVPCRETKMTPYEIMLSESQERMLIVLENGKEDQAKKIFDKWNLDFAIIGKTTNTKNIELFFDNKQVANIPVDSLVENSPMYNRKWKKSKLPKKNKIKKEVLNKLKIKDVLKKILSNQNVCSKEWIWQQYDHTVMGDTIQKPGGDAGVVRIHGTNKAIAASVDSSAVYCWAHPLTGGKQVVAESWRNLVAVGATPIAITNCLNFGSPEKEDNMGEFVECVQGIGEASEYLNFPVVSGNVSFYNQTKEVGIKPTPSIGGVGLIKDYEKMITMDFKENNNLVLIIGKTEGHIDQSLFARTVLDEKNGPPPEINLFNEKNNGESLLDLIDKNCIKSAHDVSLGGLITALSIMCIKGNKGIKLKKSKNLMNEIEYFFAEDQGRYIVEINPKDLDKVTDILKKNSVHHEELGVIIEKEMIINEKTKVTIDELRSYNTNWLKNYMSS
jgi:phosphoribosylformylglycinamidine synthase